MDFIFKQDLLNLDKNKHINVQYYQWAQKKRAENEKAQYEELKKRWEQLESQQSKNSNKQDKKNKIVQKPTSIKPEITYMKNMIWKQKVQEKIGKIRQQQMEEMQKQEIKQLNSIKEQSSYRYPQHKGPIKAWTERFQTYLKSKSGQDADNQERNFRPVINKNSKRMVSGMNVRVEDRLLDYGQKLKEKKAEMQAAYQQQLNYMRKKGALEVDESQVSNIFFRLYKDGEEINKKKNQNNLQYSFTPSINSHSIQLASRISQKRKPLYQSKLIEENVNSNKTKTSMKDKQSRIKGFDDFLKRNQALLRKINNHKLQRIQIVKTKENKETKECTFAPNLNPNSLRMVANKHNQIRPPLIEKTHQQNSQSKCFPQGKKIVGVKSSVIQIDSHLMRSSIGSRKSQGNYIRSNTQNYASDIDSLSNVYAAQQQNFDNIQNIRKNLSQSLSGEPELFTTDRNYERSGVINEEIEEDSIEREKEMLWENELQQMEMQIEEMMKRAN